MFFAPGRMINDFLVVVVTDAREGGTLAGVGAGLVSTDSCPDIFPFSHNPSALCRQPEGVPVGEGDDDGDVSTFMAELDLEGQSLTAVKREIPAAAADKRRSSEGIMGERGQFAPIEEEQLVQGE